jgi:hypothetical protein
MELINMEEGYAHRVRAGRCAEKFTIKDVYNIFGYMSFSFAMAQNRSVDRHT